MAFDLSAILSALRPYTASAAAKPGLFRTVGSALLGRGPLGPAVLALPQMSNFGKAFDTAGRALSDGVIANDFAMMHGVPYATGVGRPISQGTAVQDYANKLRTGAVPSGVAPISGAMPWQSGVPLPTPRPQLSSVPMPIARPTPNASSVPLPTPSPIPKPPAVDTSPYGFVNSPGYMGEGSTRPSGLFDLIRMLSK